MRPERGPSRADSAKAARRTSDSPGVPNSPGDMEGKPATEEAAGRGLRGAASITSNAPHRGMPAKPREQVRLLPLPPEQKNKRYGKETDRSSRPEGVDSPAADYRRHHRRCRRSP
nr:MAG TPA: hypothetical protein [Caudoviricetes sp.]